MTLFKMYWISTESNKIQQDQFQQSNHNTFHNLISHKKQSNTPVVPVVSLILLFLLTLTSLSRTGPLMGWLEAQIKFGEMMTQNAPLFNKLRELQGEFDSLVAKLDSIPVPPSVPALPSYQVTRLGGCN